MCYTFVTNIQTAVNALIESATSAMVDTTDLQEATDKIATLEGSLTDLQVTSPQSTVRFLK